MEYKNKYLKYKTKYLELKGGANTMYDLSNKRLYCYSDEEGGNPFKNLDPVANEQLIKDFKFENGMITDFNNDQTALAFMGDLLDNSKYSIRLLKKFIKLKQKYTDRVILIGGNRDFNKVRMGIELFFSERSEDADQDKKLPWHDTTNFQQLKERLESRTFDFRETEIPAYLQNVGIWNNVTNITNGTSVLRTDYNQSFRNRLNSMFKKTKGVNSFGDGDGYIFIIDELNEMCGLANHEKLIAADETSAKIICAIQMLMSFNWPDNLVPEYLQKFNGLYLSYLAKCHVISVFEINGKYGVLSHSGMIQKVGADDRKLTYPFGYDYLNEVMGFNPSTLVDVVSKIESEKMNLINQVQSKMNNMYNTELDFIIDKFVHLTAGTSFSNLEGANFKNSPIVGSQTIPTNSREDIRAQIGGNGYTHWINHDKQIKNKVYVKTDGENSKIISYNIFGHAPQYLNPTLSRKSDNGTLHVNLDISKIEANTSNNNSANNSSFAFLVIDGITGFNSIIGRILFPFSNNPSLVPVLYINSSDAIQKITIEINRLKTEIKTEAIDLEINRLNKMKKEYTDSIYLSNAYLDNNALNFQGQIYNYNMPINNGIIDISLNSTIPGTNIKVTSYPPIDFTKYFSTLRE